MPVIAVREGEGAAVIRDYLAEHPEVAALVLGAAAEGATGAAGELFLDAFGRLPCPVFVVPGGLSDEDIDRLS